LDRQTLEQAVVSLLEPGIYKTTAQVAEELKMEYPHLWRQLEKEGETLFGYSCTTIQQPYTRISQTLFSLPEKYRYKRQNSNELLWGLPA